MAYRGGQRSLRPVVAATAVLAAVVVFPSALKAQEGRAGAEDATAELGDVAGARSGSSTAAKSTESVDIRNFTFRPKTVTIDAGDSVRWRNRDSDQHNATGRGNSFATPDLDQGDDATERFDDAGTFRYICDIHPDMKGTVEVEAAGGGADPATTGAPGDSIEDPIPPGFVEPSDLGFDDTGSTADSSDSGGSLPATGEEELPLFALGAALLAAGLLVGAAAAWAEWAR